MDAAYTVYTQIYKQITVAAVLSKTIPSIYLLKLLKCDISGSRRLSLFLRQKDEMTK